MKRHLSATAVRILTVAMTVFATTANNLMAIQGNWVPNFLALWPAVYLAAYLGGWRHAAGSIVLGATLTAFTHPLMRDGHTMQQWLVILAYLACGGCFVWYCKTQKAVGVALPDDPLLHRFSPQRVLIGSIVTALFGAWGNFYLFPALGKSLPFAIFYPLMAAAGFLGGARPVIAVMLISLTTVSLWQHDLAGAGNTGAFDVLRGVYVFIGLTYALFSDAVVRQRARAIAGAVALRDLPEAKARFSALAQTSPDALWLWDADTRRFTFCSEASVKITGRTPEEIIGRSEAEYRQHIHPSDAPIVDAAQRAIAIAPDGQTVEYEYRHQHRDGSWRWLRNRIGIFTRHVDGTVAQIFGHTEDVTERRDASEQLTAQAAELARIATEREATILEREALLEAERTARGEAERANRLKDDFLATVSHELRTPLSAIVGWVALLSEDAKDPELVQGLEVITRNARAQRQLIDDLLDMSRIISGKLRINPQPVVLSEVLSGAMETAMPAAQAREIELVSQVEGCEKRILADADRLQQIIWNLVSNAVKFTPAGGKVSLRATCIAGQATISVADTGQGMALDFVPHVFERFRQEDGAITRKAGGLGLGLAIVKHLVELHGGTISAQSEGLGKGSVFTITLPLQTKRMDLPSGQPSGITRPTISTVSKAQSSAIAGRHILVIDDEDDTRTYLHRVLTERGVEVTVAESAAEGLCRALDGKPHAIICDISMPGEDGYSFIRHLRLAEDPTVRAIPAAALTALARMEDRQRALDAGFNEHCAKPVEPAELLALVLRLLPGAGK